MILCMHDYSIFIKNTHKKFKLAQELFSLAILNFLSADSNFSFVIHNKFVENWAPDLKEGVDGDF